MADQDYENPAQMVSMSAPKGGGPRPPGAPGLDVESVLIERNPGGGGYLVTCNKRPGSRRGGFEGREAQKSSYPTFDDAMEYARSEFGEVGAEGPMGQESGPMPGEEMGEPMGGGPMGGPPPGPPPGGPMGGAPMGGGLPPPPPRRRPAPPMPEEEEVA